MDAEEKACAISGSSHSRGSDGRVSSGMSTGSVGEGAADAGIGDAPLPPGWSARTTPSGATYYENHSAKSTTWERPAAPVVPQAAPSHGHASDGRHGVHPGVDSGVDGGGAPLPQAESTGGNSTKHGRWGTGNARFTDSVYMWACGDKTKDQDEDLKTSDVMIGWLVLLALAYTVVIWKSDRSSGEDISYSLVSVTVAFYLLIATAAPDLRMGFSLLVDGTSTRYRVFGASLLGVFGLMVTAAMVVLFSSAENDTDVVANAVTVLFIADLDEKALTFFLTVPQKWRLFWVMNMIGISITLAVVGLVYVGDASVLDDAPIPGFEKYNSLGTLSSWFMFAVNPSCCTYFAFVISQSLQAVFDARDSGGGEESKLPWWGVFRRGVRGAANALCKEPGLYAALIVWFVVGAIGWSGWLWLPFGAWTLSYGDPIAARITTSSDSSSTAAGKVGLGLTFNYAALVAASMALAFGLAVFALRFALRQTKTPSPKATTSPQRSQRREIRGFAQGRDENTNSNNNRSLRCFCTGCLNGSRVPSVLVGWGLGYWATSMLFLLGSSWSGGGWDKAHVAVSIVGYIVLPLAFVCGIFMIADADFLGAHLEPFLRPIAVALKNPDGVFRWVMVTVLRDAVFIWLVSAHILYLSLNVV